MTEYHFTEPLDILYLRGNRLFADASTPGEALMPPWPSMAAGALRSQILATHQIDAGKFAVDQVALPLHLQESLGTPSKPGSFRISDFLLAKVRDQQIDDVYLPLPADVIVQNNRQLIYYLQPESLPSGLLSSAPCQHLPVLRSEKPAKPEGGIWINAAGIQAWLNAEPLKNEHLVLSGDLWKLDARLGITLAPEARTTVESQLYTVETVALARGIGFLSGVSGAPGLLPQQSLVRLGGDGRGAQQYKVAWQRPKPKWEIIDQQKRFRLLLTTPGLFEAGWLLPGMRQNANGFQWQTDDFSARLITASVARADTISGWDIAAHQPKPALKSVSSGSVYWFDQFEGDVNALGKLVEQSLFAISDYPDRKRRAEGFNNIMIAAWPL